jgi:hypothetical protein
MSEVSRRQGGATISPRLSSMTGLAGLRVQIPAGGNCGRIPGKRILYRVGRIRALSDHNPGTQTYRRHPKINTNSPDLMCPSSMDHLLWSSLLVRSGLVSKRKDRAWSTLRPLLVFQQALGIHPLEKEGSPARDRRWIRLADTKAMPDARVDVEFG